MSKMKFKLFGLKTVLDPIESETLAVSLADAWKELNYQRERLNKDSRELPAIVAKINRLEALQTKLGLES